MDSKLIAIIAALSILTTSSFMSFSSSADDFANDFAAFKNTHGKVYETIEEEVYRFAVFCENALTIREHNNKNEGSTLGYTQFADLSFAEF